MCFWISFPYPQGPDRERRDMEVQHSLASFAHHRGEKIKLSLCLLPPPPPMSQHPLLTPTPSLTSYHVSHHFGGIGCDSTASGPLRDAVRGAIRREGTLFWEAPGMFSIYTWTKPTLAENKRSDQRRNNAITEARSGDITRYHSTVLHFFEQQPRPLTSAVWSGVVDSKVSA